MARTFRQRGVVPLDNELWAGDRGTDQRRVLWQPHISLPPRVVCRASAARNSAELAGKLWGKIFLSSCVDFRVKPHSFE